MLAEVVDHARAISAPSHLHPAVEVDQLALDPDQGGADLVVVDQLPGVLDARARRRRSGREPVDERLRPAPRSRSCARPASAGRTRAARPCRGSGAAARPTTGRCSRGSRRRASSARPGASRSPSCRSREGCRPAGKPRKTGVREDIIPVTLPAPQRRVRRHPEQQRQVAADPVGDVDRLLGVVDADVDVGAEDQLPLGDPAELRRPAPGSAGGRRSPGPRRAPRDGCRRRRSPARARPRPRAPRGAARAAARRPRPRSRRAASRPRAPTASARA